MVGLYERSAYMRVCTAYVSMYLSRIIAVLDLVVIGVITLRPTSVCARFGPQVVLFSDNHYNTHYPTHIKINMSVG